MKKRILSLILTVAMMLSVMAILPISVSAEEVATFDGTTNLTIKNNADIARFDEMVEGGNSFAGVTITLGNDITLLKTFDGIGMAGKRFAGTFDGQGYTITADGHDVGDDTGELFVGIDGATIKNFTYVGRVNMVSAYAAGVVCSAIGNSKIQNVRVSLYMQSNADRLTYCAAFVATMSSGTNSLTIDSCVFDGIMNFSSYAGECAAFLAQTISGSTITITNSVFAGTMSFNDKDSRYNGCFIGYSRPGAPVTVENCISIGKMTFANKTSIANSLVVGEKDGTNTTLTLNNFYYVPFNATLADKTTVASVGILQGMTVEAAKANGNIGSYSNVATKTLDEIAALTSETLGFSANAAFSFKENTYWDTYYPCPTGLVKDGAWVDSLVVSVDAKVLGAQIRITDPADAYSGIRFVAEFRETLTTGANTADANFGLILVSKTAYEALTEKNFTAIKEAGVEVPAVKASTEDGVVTVKATVYNIQAANYRDEIVAIPYVNGAIVGEAVARSIFGVATDCVADANATTVQKTFAQEIIDNAPAVEE